MIQRSAAALLVAAALVVALPAQSAHVYRGNLVNNVPLPGVTCTTPMTQVPMYPAPPLGGFAGMRGGMAIDHLTNRVYFSDGTMIGIIAHPSFPSPGIVPAPAPVPPAACVGGVGVITPFGPVTGMAIMPGGVAGALASTLLVTDGACIMGLAPLPPFAIVIPPFPVPVLTPAPLSGLEFDSVTGTIWACDVAGTSYNINVGGGLVGPPVPLPGAPALPVVGNVLDRSIPGGALWVTDGLALYPVFGAPPAPIPLPPSPGIAGARGSAFSAEPLVLPGACGCAGSTPMIRTSGPVVAGPAPFGIRMTGAPGGGTAFLGIDTVCAGPFAFGPGCTWWLSTPAPLLIGPLAVSASGGASVNFGTLPPAAIGLTVYAQWLTSCPIALAPVLSDALHLRVSAL